MNIHRHEETKRKIIEIKSFEIDKNGNQIGNKKLLFASEYSIEKEEKAKELIKKIYEFDEFFELQYVIEINEFDI